MSGGDSVLASGRVNVVVVGAGAFGQHHLRIYRELEEAGYPIRLAGLVEPNPAAAAHAGQHFHVPAFPTIEACLAAVKSPHAASVCVPTLHHAAVARQLLTAGLDLLIEKPLAATLEQADEILTLAARHSRVVQPGHLERFNPAVIAARPLLNRPMFFEAHRLSIFTPRSLDVDVVLDLMIHDLDIVLSFTQSPVKEVRAVGLPVLSPKVDIANVRVEFDNGSVANFTASRISTERVRKLRFFQPHQYLSLDFARQDLLLIDVTAAALLAPEQLALLAGTGMAVAGKEKADDPHAAAAAAGHPDVGSHPTPGLSLEKIPVQPGEPLRLEIEAFLEAVRARTQPVVTAQAGRDALALALEINRTIAVHAHRAGLTR